MSKSKMAIALDKIKEISKDMKPLYDPVDRVREARDGGMYERLFNLEQGECDGEGNQGQREEVDRSRSCQEKSPESEGTRG